MRRPFIEATALLAAHGHPVPPPRPVSPWSFRMSDAQYALIIPGGGAKPRLRPHADLTRLAQGVQRLRGQQAIQCVDAEIPFDDVEAPRHGVSIFSLSETGEQNGFLGWAYLNGKGREVLEGALQAVGPRPPVPFGAW